MNNSSVSEDATNAILSLMRDPKHENVCNKKAPKPSHGPQQISLPSSHVNGH